MNPPAGFWTDGAKGYTPDTAFTADTVLRAVETGDVSMNGTTDTADVILMLQQLVGYEMNLPTPLADVNKDTQLTIFDVVFLLRSIGA